jgi:hypothetical protein
LGRSSVTLEKLSASELGATAANHAGAAHNLCGSTEVTMPHPLLPNCSCRALAGLTLATLVGSLALSAQAQTQARAIAADPLDAKAAVPALVYRSALTGYPRMAQPPAMGWREANDNVTRIGGWRAYAREAQQPPASAPAASAPPPHAGHGAHKAP